MTSRKTAFVGERPEAPENNTAKTIDEERLEAVNGFFQLGQWACLCFGDLADAGAIGVHGPNISAEVMHLVEKNNKIAKRLDLLIEIGPYTGIIAAALPFVAQILVNHKIVKAERFANAGVVHPEALEAQMTAQLQMQQMMAMRRQQEMEDQLRQMQEEMMAKANMNGNGPSEETDFGE